MAKNGNGASSNEGTPQAETVRYTVKQLVALAALQQPPITLDAVKVRNAVRNNPIFKEEGAVILVDIEGTDYPPIQKISSAAAHKWFDELRSPKATLVSRARTDGQKYVIRVKPDQINAITELLSAHGITLAKANTAKPKAKQAAIDGVAADATATSEPAPEATPAIDALFEQPSLEPVSA